MVGGIIQESQRGRVTALERGWDLTREAVVTDIKGYQTPSRQVLKERRRECSVELITRQIQLPDSDHSAAATAVVIGNKEWQFTGETVVAQIKNLQVINKREELVREITG